MDNNYTHFIEGAKIYLREVNLNDVNENYYRWLNDSEVNRYLETKYIPQSMETIRKYVEEMADCTEQIFLAICLSNSDEHIGNIKLGPINWIHRRGEISLFIGEKKYWGNGYATEAIKLAKEFAFNRLNLHKLTAGCFSENIGSQKAFFKAGFISEGVRRKHFYMDGKYHDSEILGIINSDHS